MSSMNITTNLSNSGIKIEFIRYIKYAGAFVRPKDMTRYSYNPYLVKNAVLGISCGLILIWWYPDLKSILENTLAFDSWSNKMSIRGKGYLFLIVTTFSGL
jgi:hypothetical protein